MRGHNKALVPIAAASNLSALDHDYHLAGVTPSVVFHADIPNFAKDSFFNGTICVTTKDKVFQPSNPMRHGAEVCQVLSECDYCSDTGELNTPFMFIYTDGGPDH